MLKIRVGGVGIIRMLALSMMRDVIVGVVKGFPISNGGTSI